MNAATMEPRPWPCSRWWMLIALVFAAHLGLIFALGDRKPVVPRSPMSVPMLSLATDPSEWLALNDPTLFVLPHRQGVARTAWTEKLPIEFRPFRWTEPPRFLALPVEQLGDSIARFMRTNVVATFQFEAKPAPELTRPAEPEIEPAPAARSTLRLAGELARRRLLNPPTLLPQPGADLLTNSVTQMLVNADGNVLSVALLPPGSGSADADQRALDLAKASRFEPLRDRAAKLTMGVMIFEWFTVPLVETNAPSTNP